MKNVFDLEGPIRDVDPLAAMVTCWREKTAGALRFSRGTAECGFDLQDGEVVAVLSSDPRFETAAILVRAGKLAPDAVEKLAPQGGDPALAALQTGILTRREWKWGEKIRAIEVLSDLLSWNDGSYRFDPEVRVQAGEFRLPVPRLLLELFLRSRDRNLIDHQIGPPEQTLVRGERFDAEFATFGLTADAESVVRLIDGKSTAAQIAERAPAEDFAVRKLLAALVTLGLVHPVPARLAERAPERDLRPEPEPERAPFPADEPEPPVEEEFARTVELPPSREAEAFPDLPTESADDEPLEGRGVELPGAEASPLDRFEPEPRPWEPEPETPPRSEPAGLWDTTPAGEESTESPDEPPSRKPGGALAWGLGLLLAAVIVVLWWRGRSELTAPAVVPNAVPTVAPAAVTFPPPVTAARLEPTRRAPVAQATARPAPTAAAPAAPAPPAAASRPAGEGRQTWDRRAQNDRRRLDGDKRTRYAIQLELVCETASLDEAWRHDRGESMWLLPVDHRGRSCYRVFWGRYPSLEAARKAKTGIPSYFITPRNKPAVVAVR